MTALIPYAGKERPKKPGPKPGMKFVIPRPFLEGVTAPQSGKLGPYSQRRALELFRAGHDTPSMAWLLGCTEAAAANALASAREEERGR